MRGLLIVNPRATTTSTRISDVIIGALTSPTNIPDTTMEIVYTEHRGHAYDLSRQAALDGARTVITLGGDGTVNEAVNGMLDVRDKVASLPMLGTVPGGSANVFSRALGLPIDPIEATGQLIESLRINRTRSISIGRAVALPADENAEPISRWFLVNAGLGLDAEIIASMDEARRAGRTASPLRYLTTTLVELFRKTERKNPALTLQVGAETHISGVFLAIVQNTAPWTYFGRLPINPCPLASFDTGLDVFALRSLGTMHALRAARRMLSGSKAGSTKNDLSVLHDLEEFSVGTTRPVRAQLDGEHIGAVTAMAFSSTRDAVEVLV